MNLNEIKEIIRVFGKSKLDKLEIKNGEFEISMKKESKENKILVPAQENNTQLIQEKAPIENRVEKEESVSSSDEGLTITSPMVGTFYAAPSPDSPPFVKAGDRVRKGQTLCILEAMKIMNELEAEFDCKILEVLVQDGQPVEYDTPLFRVEKL